MHQAERGVFDLRRGHPIHLFGPAGGILTVAVETMAESHPRELAALTGTAPRLLLTPRRAFALGLRGTDGGAVSMPVPADATTSDIMALASAPVTTLSAALLRQITRPVSEIELGALNLAKTGRLLPAMLSVPVPDAPGADLLALLGDSTLLSVPAEQAATLMFRPRLRLARTSDAPVPLEDAEKTRFMLFREDNGVLEHLAILIGDPGAWQDPVPVRLHSACLTGDLFGSLRCDCGEQLRNSVRAITAEGGGVLLYLAQEGRGIGLANKLRAYTIQDQGMDTVDADRTLGFNDDERRYEAAVAMLEEIGVNRVRLFTNNPEKVAALARGGIEIVDRQPLHGTINPHNLGYLNTKAERAGHMLDGLLEERDAEGR
ncbi:MAG: GTP cyclohydrolase II [Aquisalimonadaceae bacterium]